MSTHTHTEITPTDSDRHRHEFPVVETVLTLAVTLTPLVWAMTSAPTRGISTTGSFVDAVFPFPAGTYTAFLVFGISLVLGVRIAVRAARTSTRLLTVTATVLLVTAVSLTVNGLFGIASDTGGICVGCPVHPYPTAH
ncbi:hypothetical protein LT337_32310 (plasmid) [Mycolicibacterium fortuitum]|nr:hypothetical protein LT337_32310 [Mycolicibacterium fortuitum]